MGTPIEDSDSIRRPEKRGAGCASCEKHFLAGKKVCPDCGDDFTQVEETNFNDE